MNTLTINGAENLEIEPGCYIYEGTTDTFLTWDQVDGDAIDAILRTIPGVIAADDYGVRTIDWMSWEDSPEGLQKAVDKAERDLKRLIVL